MHIARGCANPRRCTVLATAKPDSNGAGRVTSVHKMITEKGVLLLPGCYDALSAKIMQQAGHQAAFVSGYAVSACMLGEPDLGLLTSSEMVLRSGQICQAVPSVLFLADADTGGNGVLNVQRTVRQLMMAGCKGAFIEDQQVPNRTGHMRNKEVIDMGDFAAKVAAARQAIGGEDFFLVARTDARGTSAKYGLEDAVKRANLYYDAGADATFVEAPRSIEELAEIGRSTKGLRVCNMLEGGVTPLLTPQELHAMGFHIVIHPMSALFAATAALRSVYDQLAKEGTTRAHLDKLANFEQFNELIGLEEKIAIEEKLTKSDAENKLYVRVRAPMKDVIASK